MAILYDLPGAWVEQVARARRRDCYRCDDPSAIEVPLESIAPPLIGPEYRGFIESRLYDVMVALKEDAALPPVTALQRRSTVVLLDGALRYFASRAGGYLQVPHAVRKRRHSKGSLWLPGINHAICSEASRSAAYERNPSVAQPQSLCRRGCSRLFYRSLSDRAVGPSPLS